MADVSRGLELGGKNNVVWEVSYRSARKVFCRVVVSVGMIGSVGCGGHWDGGSLCSRNNVKKVNCFNCGGIMHEWSWERASRTSLVGKWSKRVVRIADGDGCQRWYGGRVAWLLGRRAKHLHIPLLFIAQPKWEDDIVARSPFTYYISLWG